MLLGLRWKERAFVCGSGIASQRGSDKVDRGQSAKFSDVAGFCTNTATIKLQSTGVRAAWAARRPGQKKRTTLDFLPSTVVDPLLSFVTNFGLLLSHVSYGLAYYYGDSHLMFMTCSFPSQESSSCFGRNRIFRFLEALPGFIFL